MLRTYIHSQDLFPETDACGSHGSASCDTRVALQIGMVVK